MISSSVGSGHPGKYSYEIPHEYLGKIISIKCNHQSILAYFSFQIATSLLTYVATFSGQLYFWRSYFFTLFQSNYSDTAVTFSGQLFLQNSCFFSFFRTVTFSQELFFQNRFFFKSETSTEQPLLETRKFFTAATFRNSYFFSEELFRIKISKKELLF